MKLLQNLIFVVTILLNVQNAYAACEDFIKNDTLLLKKDVAVQWSYSDQFLSSKNTFDSANASGSGYLDGAPFYANYEATKTFNDVFKNNLTSKFNSEDKTDLLISNLSDNAVKLYKICIQGAENKPHLILSIHSYTNKLVTVRVFWDDASTGLALESIVPSFGSGNKADVPQPNIPRIRSGFSTDINYERIVGQDFALTVIAKATGGDRLTTSYADSIRLPYVPEIKLKTRIVHRTNKEADISGTEDRAQLYLYGGNPDGGSVRSAIAYSSKPYYFIDPKTVTFAYKQVQGMCNMTVMPIDATGLTKTSKTITGSFAIAYTHNCGGAYTGNLEWDEYYTEYFQDDVSLNPIPKDFK